MPLLASDTIFTTAGTTVIGAAATWLFLKAMEVWKIRRDGSAQREETIVTRQDKAIADLEAKLAAQCAINDELRDAQSGLSDRMHDAELKSAKDVARLENHVTYLESLMRAAKIPFRSFSLVVQKGSAVYELPPSDEVKG